MNTTRSIALLCLWLFAIPMIAQEDDSSRETLGNTLLHNAAEKDAFEEALLLITEGADVEAKNNSGDTPLHIAAQHNALWEHAVASCDRERLPQCGDTTD